MREITRRAFLTIAIGTGAAALSGCRRASASPAPARDSRGAGTAVPASRARPAEAGRRVEQIEVDGVTRKYVRYEPAGLDPAAAVPLVLVLHGRGGTGAIAERMYDMRAQSDAHGFVVAYPDALGDPPTWHSGLGMGGSEADDVGFIRALVAREAGTRPIDPNRTFVCGHSSGALMTYRLAGEASDLFPAVGVVAGAVGVRGPGGRSITIQQPDHAVSVIHFHGTEDRLIPYNGGSERSPAGVVSVTDSIGFWVQADGCNRTPTTETIGTARRETYSGGRDGSEVTLWTIQGGGHEWPKTHTAVRPSNMSVAPAGDVSATELIWTFFAAHPRASVS